MLPPARWDKVWGRHVAWRTLGSTSTKPGKNCLEEKVLAMESVLALLLYVFPLSYRVFCLLGDGESSEGAVWEAMAFASHYQLDNLVAIFDVNRLGQSEAAPLQHQTDVYRKRCEAFG